MSNTTKVIRNLFCCTYVCNSIPWGFFAFTLLLQHTEGMLNVYTVSRSRPVLCGNNIESYKQQLKSTKSRIYAKHFTKGSLTWSVLRDIKVFLFQGLLLIYPRYSTNDCHSYAVNFLLLSFSKVMVRKHNQLSPVI